MSYNFDRIIRVDEPTTEPVTLAEAKEQLRFDGTEEDDYITGLISVARDYIEKFCNRYWASADAILTFDFFPVGSTPFDLNWPDISVLNTVTYRDTDNAEQTISTGLYIDSDLRQMYSAADWPLDETSVKVNVTMGPDAGASPAETIPPAIKQAILLVITDLYNNRATVTTMQTYENEAVSNLAHPYRTQLSI
tara:strand:- start:2876 stop:3454 length:579 start_codon:yes stop_codon:yes gene_type:complete